MGASQEPSEETGRRFDFRARGSAPDRRSAGPERFNRVKQAERSPVPAAEESERRRYPHQTDLKTKLKTELSDTADSFNIAPKAPGFRSPPLLAGLLESLKGLVGRDAKPTAIQALSLEHFVSSQSEAQSPVWTAHPTLLASETGSGKSIAYLVPVLQGLKETEDAMAAIESLKKSEAPSDEAATNDPNAGQDRPSQPLPSVGPRAIILTPTHELSRQITTFAKALTHNIKLRIQCASNPNRTSKRNPWDENSATLSVPEGERDGGRPLDALVGTPSKILSLSGGVELEDRSVIPGSLRTWEETENGRTIGAPRTRMSLDRVEWVVVDEADVLFGTSYQELRLGYLAELLHG